ncbi:MAG: zinc-dependent metalloprotease [Phycisphaerales bacterium]|nr:zinc-dependent metalloprotease [Phycisphaerales bacterium]
MERSRFGIVNTRALVGVVGAVVGIGALSWASVQQDAAQGAAAAQDSAVGDGTAAIDLSAMAGMMRGGGGERSASDLPEWKDVSSGYTKVVSTTDGDSLFGLWINRKDNKLLAEMPRGYESQKHFFAMTVAGGEIFAGLQAGDLYCYWKRIGNTLALIAPQIDVRSSGDQESRDSVEMIFTDQLILDVPIVATGPGGQPVIDLNGLLLGNATKFFGASAAGVRANLAEVTSAKAFPQNIEIAFKVPVGGGTIKTLHYSISKMEGTRGYKPRKADERVGYFTTSFRDLGKFDRDDVNVRYINRWNLEKADPKLKMSPPKQPIIFYVEHTVPVRYRRWVRAGIEYWNKAFEQVGIVGAVEVRFQDKETGAHMDKDPEDVRYNFIRWLSNDISTAIGPSRVNPMTGEILDADVVLTDGWIRVFTYQWGDLMPKLATEGMSPQTLAWLERNPTWDPRVRLADPLKRDAMMRGLHQHEPFPLTSVDGTLIGDDEFDGLVGRTSQVNGYCAAADGKALNLALMRMYLELGVPSETDVNTASALASSAQAEEDDEIPAEMLEKLRANPELMALLPAEARAKVEKLLAQPAAAPRGAQPEEGGQTPTDEEKPKKEEPKEDLIDGVPESFVGQSLGELVAHEVGHTLGLRHNFKATSCYSMAQINSEELKGKKPFATSVMDYTPVNIRMPGTGTIQGDYTVIDIGPYDMWAIEYGYGLGDTSKILARCVEPELQYGTDEDTWGPDPFARRYDLSSDPLDYAKNQMELAQYHRKTLLEKFVKDGESWSKARYGYQITLNQQVQSLSMMARWVGGAYVYRDKKGDPNGRAPIEVVEPGKQRAALNYLIDHSFKDEVYGLSPEMLRHMTVDKWYDAAGEKDLLTDPTFTVHDTIAGVQATALTLIMNPYTLQRVYDNEFFTPAGTDALTLPELLNTVYEGVWGEIAEPPAKKTTAREPMISSLRRNLQREHVQRLIDLSIPGSSSIGPAERSISTLATAQLRRIQKEIEGLLKGQGADRIDPYSIAHLDEVSLRIGKALDAQFIYNN